MCHLPPVSLSPRASIPGAGGGGGAADSAPPSWLFPRRLAASALALALGTPSQLPRQSPSFKRRLPPPPGRPRCCTLRDAKAVEGGDLGGGSLNSGWGGYSGLGSRLGDSSVLLLALLGILSASRSQGVRPGVAFRVSLDCTSETALRARAWPPPLLPPPIRLRPLPAPAGWCSLAPGVRGWHLPPQSAQQGVGARSPREASRAG